MPFVIVVAFGLGVAAGFCIGSIYYGAKIKQVKDDYLNR